MRQLAVQRAFLEPAREFADPRPVDFNQLLLLAIEQALAPPIFHRRSVFQPMRVIVVTPESISGTRAPDESNGETPRGLSRTLPHVEQISSHNASRMRHRSVRGEILSDETGKLFEKIGRQIRPIHQLASGPFGEVIDLIPFEQAAIAPPTRPRAVQPAKTAAGPENAGGANSDIPASRFAPVRNPTEQSPPVSHRKLFADPGQWRVLCWRDFKEILARQLAHPERLRDTYRLPCYVQVLETQRAVSFEELAATYKSKSDREAGLYFLTDEIAAKLDLVLPLRPAPPAGVQRSGNILLPHERVFRLIVANDPTVDITSVNSKVQATVSTGEADCYVKPCEPAAATGSLKDGIPARFLKEWEFKISREEASYDMNAKRSLGDLVVRFCRRLRPAMRRSEFRKWQALLLGKDVDEQLWAVRPPARMPVDSLVRAWAVRTLESGGYDSRKMISEWEIFWRRKGL